MTSKAEIITTAISLDERCLDTMRALMKEFILESQSVVDREGLKRDYKGRYEAAREQLHDEGLKAFTPFELMEKLYWQEYLVSK